MHSYPRPILAGDKVPGAAMTCVHCHNPERYLGNRLVVLSSYGDDEKNTITRTPVLLHLGGRDASGRLSGIHGAHLAHIEFVSADSQHQTITAVRKTNPDGSITEFVSDPKAVSGPMRSMDCIDCHNRPAHSFDTPEAALDKQMAAGTLSASLPFVHKQGLALLRAEYSSQEVAETRIKAGIESFYQTQYPAVWASQRAQIEQAGQALSSIYRSNVFPFMKVTWGTHPNNIGHTADLAGGCFRCHDGNHTAKNGTSITNDCSVCHSLISADDPKLVAELGMK
jgi:hypothetical protein